MKLALVVLICSVGWGQTIISSGTAGTATTTVTPDYTTIITFKKVDVKKLTDTQKKAISDAEKKLEVAKMEYYKIVDGVKAAHGVIRYTGRTTTTGCNPLVMSAEILNNEWIVIRTEAIDNCTFTIEAPVEPIK